MIQKITPTTSVSKRDKSWLAFVVWLLGLGVLANIPGWPPLGTLLWTVVVICAHWYWGRRGAASSADEGRTAPAIGESWSTKNCPECYEHIPSDAERCDHCGKKQKANDSTCSGGVETAAKAKSYFAQERRNAKKVGSPGYIWRTGRDGAVCERCAANEGRTFSWDTEPPGGHAGAKARCRCYPETIIPS